MNLLDKTIDWITNFDKSIVPIIGTPGAGKTYFLASLAKWALHNLQEPERIFLNGKDYLYNLAIRLATIEVDLQNRTVNGSIERNVYTHEGQNSHQVRLRIPPIASIGNRDTIDLVTVDGPGEILIERISDLRPMVRKMSALILLIDIIGDDAEATDINWTSVSDNAVASIEGLSKVVHDELSDETPIALVVTKWDRVLSLPHYAEEDERRQNWDSLRRQIENIYLPLIKMHHASVFMHSSIGRYASMNQAIHAGANHFPYPFGVEQILQHCTRNA